MRPLPLAAVIAAGLSCAGCFQLATVIHIAGDGRGTLEQRVVFTQAALDQLKQLALLGGGNQFDPLSEQEAQAGADRLGSGVTVVSSTPIVEENGGRGRLTTYAFTDVTQLRISQQPEVPRGAMPGMDRAADALTARFTRAPNGNALLTITVPQPNALGSRRSAGAGARSIPSPEQLAMFKEMFHGATVSLVVEPVGTLVRTNSAFVDGQRVTLMDVNLDQLFSDDTLSQRMDAAKSADELRAILKDAPGLKLNLDREITIEFAPR